MTRRQDIVEELCAAIEQDRRSPCTIAHMAGVSPTCLSLWLTGRVLSPRVDTIARVAAVLGLSLTWSDDHWTLRPIFAPDWRNPQSATPAKSRPHVRRSWLGAGAAW